MRRKCRSQTARLCLTKGPLWDRHEVSAKLTFGEFQTVSSCGAGQDSRLAKISAERGYYLRLALTEVFIVDVNHYVLHGLAFGKYVALV